MKNRLLTLGLLAAILLLITGCLPATQQKGMVAGQAQKPNLRVGVSTNSPPFVYKTGSGQLQGLEIEFASMLGKFLNRNVEFVELSWPEQLPALEESKIDIIMSGMTITAKRQYRAAFTRPYMRAGQILLVRSDETGRFNRGVYSLMGNTPHIGVIEGTTGDLFITKTINRPKLTRFRTSRQAVDALAAGEIDVIVHDAPILCHYAATYDATQLTPIMQMATEEYLAWAVNKGNIELLKAANEFLSANAGNQQLQQIIHRWIPYF